MPCSAVDTMRTDSILFGLALALAGCSASSGPTAIDDSSRIDEPIQVGQQTLAPALVEARLVQELGFASPGGHMYCAYQLLGKAEPSVYLWVVCEEHETTHHALRSGVSGPVALTIDPTAPRILAVRQPRDGGLYRDDIETIFPSSVLPQIFADVSVTNKRVHALEDAISKQERAASGAALD